jgi:hypothetical protein
MLITPMDALGATSGVIAVVQLAASIAKLCGGYIADVKDARQDIERLQQKASVLCDVLQRVADANNRHEQPALRLSADMLNAVDSCSENLEKLREKLQPKTRHRTMSKFGVRALKWPLSKSTVNEEVQWMEDYLVIFNTALQLDHMYVLDLMMSAPTFS